MALSINALEVTITWASEAPAPEAPAPESSSQRQLASAAQSESASVVEQERIMPATLSEFAQTYPFTSKVLSETIRQLEESFRRPFVDRVPGPTLTSAERLTQAIVPAVIEYLGPQITQAVGGEQALEELFKAEVAGFLLRGSSRDEDRAALESIREIFPHYHDTEVTEAADDILTQFIPDGPEPGAMIAAIPRTLTVEGLAQMLYEINLLMARRHLELVRPGQTQELATLLTYSKSKNRFPTSCPQMRLNRGWSSLKRLPEGFNPVGSEEMLPRIKAAALKVATSTPPLTVLNRIAENEEVKLAFFNCLRRDLDEDRLSPRQVAHLISFLKALDRVEILSNTLPEDLSTFFTRIRVQAVLQAAEQMPIGWLLRFPELSDGIRPRQFRAIVQAADHEPPDWFASTTQLVLYTGIRSAEANDEEFSREQSQYWEEFDTDAARHAEFAILSAQVAPMDITPFKLVPDYKGAKHVIPFLLPPYQDLKALEHALKASDHVIEETLRTLDAANEQPSSTRRTKRTVTKS
ncbi:MAG: hypothetical protein LBJ77_01305 [Holosporales bacterium]|nr:hypothetical protein [Holosporales bacterium]